MTNAISCEQLYNRPLNPAEAHGLVLSVIAWTQQTPKILQQRHTKAETQISTPGGESEEGRSPFQLPTTETILYGGASSWKANRSSPIPAVDNPEADTTRPPTCRHNADMLHPLLGRLFKNERRFRQNQWTDQNNNMAV